MFGIAAHTGSSQPTIVDVPEPRAVGKGEVLCRTLQLGVCGTDREILRSEDPWVPTGENQLVLGHECLARVEAVGAGVDGVKVDELVVPIVRRAKATAPSIRPDMLAFGQYTECGILEEHGWSLPHWIDRPEYLFHVDKAIEDVAVLTEPLTVAEKGVNEALALQRGRLGDDWWTDASPRVLVPGMGPIGFAAVVACVCRGWPVTMYGRDDTDTFRASLAQRLGAKYLNDAQFDDDPADLEGDGYDLILECTGSDDVMLRTSGALASRGIMVWLGASRLPQPKTHNVSQMMRRGILRNHVHVATVNAALRDFTDALSHLAQFNATHPVDLRALITTRTAPRESLWHFEHREPQGIKTVLMYD